MGACVAAMAGSMNTHEQIGRDDMSLEFVPWHRGFAPAHEWKGGKKSVDLPAIGCILTRTWRRLRLSR
jgi:hypothetical protein